MTVEVWPGSRLSLAGDTVTEALGTGAPDPFVLGFLLVMSLLLILLFGRLMAAVAGGVSFVRSAYSTSETLDSKYLCDSIFMMYLVVIPFYAVALRVSGLGGGYMWVLGAVGVLLLLRKAVYALLGWLSGRQAVIRNVEKVSCGIFILVALLSFLPVPALLLFPPEMRETYRIYLLIILLIGCFFYAKRSLELISSSGFSSFFWVLYLCTLEILPVCVVVNYLMNGN